MCRSRARRRSAPGAKVTAEIDWDRRHRQMRMHTCLHLLCAVIKGDVTGGQVSDGKGRLDFNLPDQSLDKEHIAREINRLIAGGPPGQPALDHRRGTGGPAGAGAHHVGEAADGQRQGAAAEIEGVDLQPCGGTHVARTGEIGADRGHQDREQGQDEPPRQPRLRRRRAMTLREPAEPGLDRVAGGASAPARPAHRRWHLLPADAGQGCPGRISASATFPARCSSISTTSPIPTRSLPHMLPPPEKFASRVRKLGIGDGNRIVIYDAQHMSAARVWWMFRIFGAREVAILDGGLAKWLARPPRPASAPRTRADRRRTRRPAPASAPPASAAWSTVSRSISSRRSMYGSGPPSEAT